MEKSPGWPAVAENLVFLRGLGDLWHAAEIARDDPTEQPFMMQPSGAKALAVASAGGHDESEILWMTCLDKALFQSHVQRLRDTTLDEPGGGHYVVVPDEGNRLFQSGDLVVRHIFGFPSLPPLLRRSRTRRCVAGGVLVVGLMNSTPKARDWASLSQ